MSTAKNSDDALIGYKLKIGDYIILKPPFLGPEKAFKVDKTTSKYARVSLKNRKHCMYFPRYYSLAFAPLQRKFSNYETRNKWIVRVNDTRVKKRLGIK